MIRTSGGWVGKRPRRFTEKHDANGSSPPVDPRSGLPVETVGCDGRSGSLYTVGDGRGDAIVSALDQK
jgi:hypothetical protein